MIYLDHAATTPMHPKVIETVQRAMREEFANSGAVYRIGLDAKRRIENAAEQIARDLQLPATHRLVFTSGGSESNNLFIKGLCAPDKKAACLGLEHPSVTQSLQSLKAFGNPPLILLNHQKEGRLDLSAVPALKENRVRLLCLSHVNNELGTVNAPGPLAEALAAQAPQTRLFLDGVQAVGKLPLSENTWKGVSGYSVSAHKIQGPKGIGILAYDSRLSLTPQIHGGKQQAGVRSGTLPLPLIVGLAESVRLARDAQAVHQQRYRDLSRLLIEGLKDLEGRTANLNLKFNSLPVDDAARQSPAIVNFSFPPVEGEVLLHHLEEKEIYVGLGSACSAHSKEPSKILTGLGRTEEEARCSLRVSFGPENTPDHVERFLEEFANAYRSLHPTFFKNTARK